MDPKHIPVFDSKEERSLILNAYKALLRDCSEFLKSKNDKDLIRRTFDFANMAHGNVRRKSGEPYILHPIGVARIAVKEIGLREPVSIAAALLHDVAEDTEYKVPYIREKFGEEIASIVEGLTKISIVIDPDSTIQAETLRNLLFTMSNDIRVALLKIADRLHNMRTIEHMKPDKQLKIASETTFLYAPIAHRLGLYSIKSELEDLSLEITEKEIYDEISQKLRDTKSERDKYINHFIKPLKDKMHEIGIECTIKGRVKSISSILKKMKKQNIPFEDVYDIFAVRLVINSNPNIKDDRDECWKAYNAITKLYRTNPERLRDWISYPKTNGYEALHTTVVSNEGRWVEVQIRTQRMDYAAEKGVAAHWKYKEGDILKSDMRLEMWLARIRELLESNRLSGFEFYEEFKTNIVSEQMYIFTPKGEVKMLPVNSIVLDFAYEIHTNVGNNAISAKVNHGLVGLGHVLQNGDKVEIITTEKKLSKEDWLGLVVTHKAKSRILDEIRVERRKIEASGKKIFDRKAQQLNFSEDHIYVKELLAELNLANIQEFYFRLGRHKVNPARIQEFIDRKLKSVEELKDGVLKLQEINPNIKLEDLIQKTRGVSSDTLLINKDVKANHFIIAACCNPIPGDQVVGFTDKKNIIIHRTNCRKAIEFMTFDGSKIVNTKWNESSGLEFLAGIKLKGTDRFGMLKDIIKIISNENHINIRSFSIDTFNGYFEGIVKLYIRNTMELENLISNLIKIEGLQKVERVD